MGHFLIILVNEKLYQDCLASVFFDSCLASLEHSFGFCLCWLPGKSYFTIWEIKLHPYSASYGLQLS